MRGVSGFRWRCVLGVVGIAVWWGPSVTRGGPVIVSAERAIRNNHASDENLEPEKTFSGTGTFDESINVEQEFDGNYDPATGRDSTITSVARVFQQSQLWVNGNGYVIQNAGATRVLLHDTHTTNPISNLYDVESDLDVSFRLDRPHAFAVGVRSDVAGGSFQLTLDGPGGRVFAFEGEIDENAPDQDNAQGRLLPGVYRLRQTSVSTTLYGEAQAVYGFDFNLIDEGPLAVPLPPAAWPALAAAACSAAGACLVRLRRRRGGVRQ